YFSPEQARGAPVDPRSDIYSLGCVLYEMTTGQPPFSGDSAVAIAYNHVQQNPVPPREIDPGLPETLEAITLKCLAKNPANRYPSARDLRADLRRYLDGARIMAEPVLAPPVDPGTTNLMEPTDYDRTAVAPGWGGDTYDDYTDEAYAPTEEEPKRSKWFLAALVLLLLILAGLLFLIVRSLGTTDGDPELVAVPNVVGQPVDEARATLEGVGFDVTEEQEASEEDQAGLVLRTNPSANEEVAEGSEVTITVGAGPETDTVPDVRGQPADQASQTISDVGFVPNPQEQPSDDVEAGLVIETQPPAGSELALGETVTLLVSTGPEALTVPDVAGMSENDAGNELTNAGFTGTIQSQPQASEDVEAGLVIGTDPGAGSEAAPDQTITLFVSSGPGQVTVPNVEGSRENNAQSQLANVGLQMQVGGEQPTNDPSQDGIVISQSPAEGQQVDQGSTVTVVVQRFRPAETTPTTEDDGNGGPGGGGGG
ncbi:MAG TPA: PASTA domain-containing protein, partial [Acidimicrobiales bacterium]|nr:PASTA domain-containing protein [Acidimicrobiales bacterium]